MEMNGLKNLIRTKAIIDFVEAIDYHIGSRQESSVKICGQIELITKASWATELSRSPGTQR